jgi:hypothetical protein
MPNTFSRLYNFLSTPSSLYIFSQCLIWITPTAPKTMHPSSLSARSSIFSKTSIPEDFHIDMEAIPLNATKSRLLTHQVLKTTITVITNRRILRPSLYDRVSEVFTRVFGTATPLPMSDLERRCSNHRLVEDPGRRPMVRRWACRRYSSRYPQRCIMLADLVWHLSWTLGFFAAFVFSVTCN